MQQRRKRGEHVCSPSSWRFLPTAVFLKGCLLRLHSFYKFFSFFFRGWGRVLIRFSVAASRVPRREDVLQRNYENSASLLEKLRNKYLDLQYLDIFHSNSTYVKGFQERYQKLQKKTFQSREGHSLKCCHIILHSLFEPKMCILEGILSVA